MDDLYLVELDGDLIEMPLSEILEEAMRGYDFSTTKLKHLNSQSDTDELVETEKRNLIIQLIDGRSHILLCDTCTVRRAGSWGGATMTSWNCAICKGSQVSGSTAHESICVGCAITRRKCRWCNYNENGIAKIFEAAK